MNSKRCSNWQPAEANLTISQALDEATRFLSESPQAGACAPPSVPLGAGEAARSVDALEASPLRAGGSSSETEAVVLRSGKPGKPSRSPRLDAEVLLSYVLGETRTRLYTLAFQAVTERDWLRYHELLQKRRQCVPVAYLVGSKEFYSRRFLVSPEVLIPRPETELLVEHSLYILGRAGLIRPRVLEVGTGSGCVAVSIALESPLAVVRATDVSTAALLIAAENVAAHHLERRVRLFEGDLFDALPPAPGGERQRFDLIVSNPPYVGTDCGPRPEEGVVRHEPSQALFAGRDGLGVLTRLVQQAPAWMNPGGYLLLEMAPFQIEGVEARMVEQGFHDTRIVADLSGLPRVLMGRWEA
jgi:release factor glutamine methyltransferase